ncbi:MAG: thiamine pyrophosphate-binding protein [Betaproteobacteria bacterium]|nr:thiamine pyrophosphate-binding protein [Betaproteobacteria bacterium]
MPRMKGADLIADFLIREEVPYVFGICGHGNVGMLDALYERQDRIRLISPRHEQTAGHMADAYYRIAHKPVATLTSCGPGSCNLVMATACASTDSSAFYAITANVPTSQFNRGPFQESYRNQAAEFPVALRPYVKRTFQPTRVDMLPLALRQSYNLMLTGRPGPVNLDVPFNLFQEEDDVEMLASDRGAGFVRPGASPEDVRRVVDLIAASERPAFFVSHGVTLAEAGPELTAVAEMLGIPVISSPNGMGTVPMPNPLALGFIGRNGTYPANQAGRHCDLLIAVGARFDDRSSSSWIPGYSWNIPPTRLVHVDIDPTEIGRNYPVDLGILADAKVFLAQLEEEAKRRNLARSARERFAPWLERIRGWREEWEAFTAPGFGMSGSPLRPERVVREVRAVLPDDAIISCDSGVHHNWFMQFWEARQPQAMLNSWGFSAMGFGVSGILGAKLAAPGRPCMAIVGDGGFTMTPHVLATAVEYDIPAIWLVWNNYSWAAIRDIQIGMFGGREIGTGFYSGPKHEPYNPDFAAMARSYGVEGIAVKHSDQLGDALRHAVSLGKPCVLDVHVDDKVKPPGTGTWQLPPTPYREPVFGERVVR